MVAGKGSHQAQNYSGEGWIHAVIHYSDHDLICRICAPVIVLRHDDVISRGIACAGDCVQSAALIDVVLNDVFAIGRDDR